MKTLHKFLIVAALAGGAVSCKKDFLDEVPQAFLSTNNAFLTDADFSASINDLYGLVRNQFYTVNDFLPFYYQYRTDAFTDMTVTAPNLVADVSPTGTMQFAWTPNYKIIAEANTIISRIPASSLTAAQKTLYEARARFFRALGYRTLAYLYGGVPLVLEEITTPKTDFVRATRVQVYTQVATDLEFAATNLPAISAVADGEISNMAAYHLLSEVYNTMGQYQKAVDAASSVINNASMGLMTSRFGSRQTVTPGDVYWDLFQPRNQNRRTANNREAIWVIQLETDVPGGAASTANGSQNGVYALERVHAPLVRDVKVNGLAPFNWPLGDYTGGRGVGFMAPSPWFGDSVWRSDFNIDIRNANNNFVRTYIGTNPASPFYNQPVSVRTPPAGATGINGSLNGTRYDRAFYPYQSKATQPYVHPTALYTNPSSSDPVQKYALKSGAGGTYIDQYMFRLAETYLLRAEAYVGLGNAAAAAADINRVRARANATPVAAGAVNIDYILDERLRELGVEEKRMLTLMRLGKWVDRTRRFNPFYGTQMQDKFNLWPIPFSEIERNRTAVLEQNPGY